MHHPTPFSEFADCKSLQISAKRKRKFKVLRGFDKFDKGITWLRISEFYNIIVKVFFVQQQDYTTLVPPQTTIFYLIDVTKAPFLN